MLRSAYGIWDIHKYDHIYIYIYTLYTYILSDENQDGKNNF